MAVRIVEDVPGDLGVRRLGRGIAVLFGVACVLAGLLAAVMPVLSVVLTADMLLRGDEISSSGQDLAEMGLLGLGAVFLLWLGLRLIRGRRRMGLYLRKFGFADTTRVVTQALSSAVGRSLRLVTLDDSATAPLGADRARRKVAGWVWLVGAALVGYVIFFLFSGSLEEDRQRNIEEGLAEAGDDVIARLADPAAQWFFYALTVILFLMVAIFVAGVALLGGGAYLAARRAERAATRRLTGEHQVDSAARELAAASRRIFAARLVVIAVPTAFWQRAVRALATASEVVVIDVSQPTDNLIWEVQNIKPMFGGRWVLVGARDRVAPLAWPATATAATPQGLLARMLDGEEIIAYGPHPGDRQRFVRALRNRLKQLPYR